MIRIVLALSVSYALRALVLALWWSHVTGSPSVDAFFFQALAMPDWLDAELLIVFAMAGAGIYTMINEGRQHRREAEERIALHARIAALEVHLGTLATSERVEVTYAILDERLEAMADKLDMHGRLSAIESRIDHKPVTHTRAKNGKFASPDAPTPETK